MNTNGNEKEYKEYKICFYFVPFISNSAILALISGESLWGPFKDGMNSGQVRGVALVSLILCCLVIYNVLVKWPKSKKGKSSIFNVFKLIFSSMFFYLWILSIIIHSISLINNDSFMYWMYLLNMIIIFYYQYKFIKRIEKLINDNSELKKLY